VAKTHVLRLFEWRLVQVQPFPKEADKLDAAGVTSSTLRSYSVWRKSMLLLAIPSLVYGALGSFADVATGDYSVFNGLGKLLLILPGFAGIVLTVGSIGGLWHWTNHAISNRWVLSGWLGSLALPFIPALFPLKLLLKEEYSVYYGRNPDEYQALATLVAFLYVFTLLPTVVSIPLGMLRAALRIRGLLPDNTLAGWIMMITIPLNTMIVLMGLVMASQFAGSYILIIAMICFLIGPLVYIYNRTLYTEPFTSELEPKLKHRQTIVRVINLVGLLLLIIWMLSDEINGQPVLGTKVDSDSSQGDDLYGENSEATPFWTYREIFQMWFEFLGRTLVATLGFADIFLRAALASWRTEVRQRESMRYDAHDGEYTVVDKELMMGKVIAAAGSSNKEKDAEGADVMETHQPDGQAGEAEIEVTEDYHDHTRSLAYGGFHPTPAQIVAAATTTSSVQYANVPVPNVPPPPQPQKVKVRSRSGNRGSSTGPQPQPLVLNTAALPSTSAEPHVAAPPQPPTLPPVSSVRQEQKVDAALVVHTAAIPSSGPRDPSMIGEPPSAHYDSNERGMDP
jgi:hypothetical protein